MAITVSEKDDTFTIKVRLCRALAELAPHAGMTYPRHNCGLPINQFQNISPMILLVHNTLDLKFSINWPHPVSSPAGQRCYAWVDLADWFAQGNDKP